MQNTLGRIFDLLRKLRFRADVGILLGLVGVAFSAFAFAFDIFGFQQDRKEADQTTRLLLAGSEFGVEIKPYKKSEISFGPEYEVYVVRGKDEQGYVEVYWHVGHAKYMIRLFDVRNRKVNEYYQMEFEFSLGKTSPFYTDNARYRFYIDEGTPLREDDFAGWLDIDNCEFLQTPAGTCIDLDISQRDIGAFAKFPRLQFGIDKEWYNSLDPSDRVYFEDDVREEILEYSDNYAEYKAVYAKLKEDLSDPSTFEIKADYSRTDRTYRLNRGELSYEETHKIPDPDDFRVIIFETRVEKPLPQPSEFPKPNEIWNPSGSNFYYSETFHAIEVVGAFEVGSAAMRDSKLLEKIRYFGYLIE